MVNAQPNSAKEPPRNTPIVTHLQLKHFLDESLGSKAIADKILKRYGLSFAALETIDSQTSISLSDFFRIEGDVARHLDDLTAHLSERKLTYETGTFVTAQINRAKTLSEAIHNLAVYFNMMHAEPYNIVHETPRSISLVIDDSKFPYTVKDAPEMVHFVGDCVLIKVQCLLDSLSGGLAEKALQHVSLKRSKNDTSYDSDGHLSFWNTPISYGQTNYTLSFDRDVALIPIHRADDIDLSAGGMFSRVIDYLDKRAPSIKIPSHTLRTQDLIRQGHLHQDDVARQLCISIATLRRRLENENTSFRNLVRAYRMEEAMTLLRRGQSVSQVTERLDYSDIRAFNRAFKRWTGETPATYAKQSANT